MSRLIPLGLVLAALLAPASASAQGVRSGFVPGGAPAGGVAPGGVHPGFRPPAHRPPVHRPRPPGVQPPLGFFSCCADFSSFPPDPGPPPLIAPAPPSIIFVVPSPPPLVYIAPKRVEPAPEIAMSNGKWERHGNGKEYPYTWVWQPAYGAR